jgi:hypothetical protein
MSTPITATPPAGNDGVVPYWPKNNTWKIWNVAELFMGPQTPGTNHYVPNVGDWAVDTNLNQFYKVTAIDPTTFVATLQKIQGPIPSDEFTDADRLLSPGPGPRSNTYLMYVNKNTKPFTAALDARLYVMGTATRTCRVVIGSALNGTRKVISAAYDNAGNLVSQDIQLEIVDGTNAVKVVPPFNTTEDLTDGEIVTAEFYSDTGDLVSQSQLRVRNTAFIRSPALGTKYVTSIGLQSPFLSSADPTQILYPLNVPLQGLNLMGVVNYSDGSQRVLPVDGTKFQLFGFNTGFVATVIGQKVPLVLKYNLSADEIAYGSTANQGNFLTREFTATTVEPNNQYTVKLFCYPIWVDAVNGYRLRWFLLNLDRTVWYDVTPYIVYQNAFNPLAYGVQQKLQVQLNLQKVNGSFLNFNFTQTVWVSLLNQGTERSTNWTIAFAPGQSPQFGVNDYAATTFVNQNLWKVNLAMGETDIDNWLPRVYGATLPLYDTQKEPGPLTPTHFSLLVGATEYEFPISQWNQDLVSNQAIPDSSTLFVRFFKRTPDNDLQLAVAGFPVYQQN